MSEPGSNVPFPPMEPTRGETHGSPTNPLLRCHSLSNHGVGSRRAKPGSAPEAATAQQAGKP
jgi:hypothetical protein